MNRYIVIFVLFKKYRRCQKGGVKKKKINFEFYFFEMNTRLLEASKKHVVAFLSKAKCFAVL